MYMLFKMTDFKSFKKCNDKFRLAFELELPKKLLGTWLALWH